MKLSEKIINLRKTNGWSQEELAEKLGVSRQAISRWEGETAQPDATNILQLSKLFGVTTDFLLNDEYKSDNDLPKVKEVKTSGLHQVMVLMVTLEIMILILQFTMTVIQQSVIWGIISFIPFIAVIGGFEYIYRKKQNEANETTNAFRKKFSKISAWLGTYFPIRFVVSELFYFYPRSYNWVVLECVTIAIYLLVVMIITIWIEKHVITQK